MAFFTDPEVIQTVTRTIEAVEKLEEEEAKKLLRRFKEVRQELRDRLDVLPSDRFTAQQQRGVLIQVDAAIQAMTEGLKNGLIDSSGRLAIRGAEDTVREINRFNKEFTGAVVPLNIDAAIIAQDSQNFLINRYQASIDAYSEDLRAQITMNLSNLALQQIPVDTMIRKMSRFFLGEEWKLRRIARTELHNSYNVSKIRSFQEAKRDVPDLKKTLFHPMDSRTADDSIQLSQQNPVVPIDKPFRFTFTRKLASGEIRTEVREFMAPPDRPNDRAVLIPYREEWNK